MKIREIRPIKICTACGMPDTRPESDFENSICLACGNYKNRKDIDWVGRQKMLKEICKKRIQKKVNMIVCAPFPVERTVL